MKYLVFLIFLSISSASLSAQNILGSVKSKTDNSSLAFANVFLNNTQVGTTTDDNGDFTLSNLTKGTYELLVSYVGYEIYRKVVEVKEENIELNIILIPKDNQLQEIVIKEDKNWQFHYNFFVQTFLGTTSNANKCKILNPDVVYLHYDYDSLILDVSTDEFLIIENKALGYRIKYLLKGFQHYGKTGLQRSLGYGFFEEMKGSPRQEKRWAKKREKAYKGSMFHFYKVLTQNTWKDEGYIIRKLERKINPNRIPEDSIRKARNSLYKLGYKFDSDTMQYWVNEGKKPRIIEKTHPNLVNTDSLLSEYKGYKVLQFSDYLLVIYTKEKEHPLYLEQIVRRPRKATSQTSVIKLTDKAAFFDKNGEIVNPLAILAEGYWAWQEKLAEKLPFGYTP